MQTIIHLEAMYLMTGCGFSARLYFYHSGKLALSFVLVVNVVLCSQCDNSWDLPPVCSLPCFTLWTFLLKLQPLHLPFSSVEAHTLWIHTCLLFSTTLVFSVLEPSQPIDILPNHLNPPDSKEDRQTKSQWTVLPNNFVPARVNIVSLTSGIVTRSMKTIILYSLILVSCSCETITNQEINCLD